MAKKEKAKKGNKKGIIIGTVAGCVIIGALMPNTETATVESINLSIPSYQAEYDIDTEVPINISVLPDGAETDSIEYVSSSDSITFSGDTLHTGSVEGTYEIYAVSGDTKSNILTIQVADITAQEEAKKKAEEEHLAREAEEKKAAEEKAAREEAKQKAAEEEVAREEAERKAAEEEAAREEAERKAAEEEAAREEAERKAAEEEATREKAEQKAAEEAEEQKLLEAQSEKTASPDANTSDTSTQETPVAPEEVAVAETSPAPAETSTTPVGGMVWLSATGEKYHRIDHCGKMNPDKARQISLEDALSQGYEKCSKCW